MSEPDKEVAAIAAAFEALRGLDDLARQRVIQWLASRFAADAHARAAHEMGMVEAPPKTAPAGPQPGDLDYEDTSGDVK